MNVWWHIRSAWHRPNMWHECVKPETFLRRFYDTGRIELNAVYQFYWRTGKRRLIPRVVVRHSVNAVRRALMAAWWYSGVCCGGNSGHKHLGPLRHSGSTFCEWLEMKARHADGDTSWPN